MLELGGRSRCQKTHKTPFAEFERSNVKSERERENIKIWLHEFESERKWQGDTIKRNGADERENKQTKFYILSLG